MLRKHKQRIKIGAKGNKIQEHDHTIENCRKYRCPRMQRDFRSQVYNVKEYMAEHDVVKRYGAFVNRLLNDQAFGNTDDPILRKKYELFVKQVKEKVDPGHTFYERMAVDSLLKEAKLDKIREQGPTK